MISQHPTRQAGPRAELSQSAVHSLAEDRLVVQLAGSIAQIGTGRPVVRVCRHCGILAADASEQNESLCPQAWPGAHSFVDVDARDLSAPGPGFPVTLEENAIPQRGVWSPGHQLVARHHGDSHLCTACGEKVPAMLREMPESFGSEVWYVIPVEADGRCPDCVWMELPAVEQMRHVGLALNAYQLSLELSHESLEQLKAVA